MVILEYLGVLHQCCRPWGGPSASSGWGYAARYDDAEVARGARRGAPRDKIVDVEAMLAILGQN